MFPPVFVNYTNETKVTGFIKVRKRPVVVDAMQINTEFQVATLEGTMAGKPGDYLIIGIRGEKYICDKDIFEETYDVVSESD